MPVRAYVLHTPGGFDEFVNAAGSSPTAFAGSPPSADETRATIERVMALAERFHVRLLAPPDGLTSNG